MKNKNQDSAIWIKNPLATSNPKAKGGAVVQGDKIVELVSLGKKPSTNCDQTFDAKNHVLLPGLVNGHHHFYQTLTRSHPAALNKKLFPWLITLYKVWANLTPKMIELSSRLALAELLLSGCTTASDHHYLFPKGLENAIDIQFEEASKLGIRVVLTRGSMTLGQEDGGLPPQSVVQKENDILQDSERLINKYHQRSDGAMQQLALAPCSPFSVSESIMVESAKLAEKEGVGLHTHLAETHDETDFCLKMFGLRPVDYLEKVGWMRPKAWLAHGIHFNHEEIKRLGKAQVGVAHCPSSNMVLASGICPTKDLESAGSPIGLGVDGSASNDGSNMIQELRQALLIGRLKYGADQVTNEDVIRWGTEGSAQCMGRTDIGKIEVGKQADLALFKLDELRFSGAGDPLAALILCGAHKADQVMVQGKWLVENGEISGMDLEQLQRDHRATAKVHQGL